VIRENFSVLHMVVVLSYYTQRYWCCRQLLVFRFKTSITVNNYCIFVTCTFTCH